jgi:hypothetical protein
MVPDDPDSEEVSVRTPTTRRTLMAATLGLLALVVAAPPVSASEYLNEGKTGEFTSRDENFNPAITCRYKANGDLDKIVVKYPFVHASDSLSNPTRKQWVGWRVIVDRRTPGGDWARWYRSPFVKKQATQEDIASYSNRTVDVPATNHQWRVRTTIKWYKVGTTNVQVGTLGYLYDWYKRKQAENPTPDVVDEYCIPEW